MPQEEVSNSVIIDGSPCSGSKTFFSIIQTSQETQVASTPESTKEFLSLKKRPSPVNPGQVWG